MSWQAYVDTSLIGTGRLDQAAIFSAAGDSCWATSPNFSLKPQEIQDLLVAFSDSGKAFEKGVHVAGTKYFCIKADDRSVYGKQGKEGVLCVKTKLAILVTHHPETVQPGEAAKVVEQLADYLISVGY